VTDQTYEVEDQVTYCYVRMSDHNGKHNVLAISERGNARQTARDVAQALNDAYSDGKRHGRTESLTEAASNAQALADSHRKLPDPADIALVCAECGEMLFTGAPGHAPYGSESASIYCYHSGARHIPRD
jgi:hypothetical protein